MAFFYLQNILLAGRFATLCFLCLENLPCLDLVLNVPIVTLITDQNLPLSFYRKASPTDYTEPSQGAQW